MYRNLFLFCAFLSVHLLCFAGEPILVSNSKPLLPVFSVILGADNKQANEDVLSMHLLIDGKPADLPVAVHYTVVGKNLQMTPANTLGYGLQFVVQYSVGGRLITKAYNTPVQPVPPTPVSIAAMYPASGDIPYNQLYFHIRFSRPMVQDPRAWRYVSVVNDRGDTLPNAWRQRSYWLDSGRLLVLMIHPGRVKSGIHYLGPLFDSGKNYRICLQPGIKAVDGSQPATAYAQTYHVVSPDRQSPAVSISKDGLPQAGTTQPLILHCSEQMDYASVFDGVSITDDRGKPIALQIAPLTGTNNYVLMPTTAWVHSNYTLILKNAVYDLAGNRLDRLFEVTDAADVQHLGGDTRLSFTVQ